MLCHFCHVGLLAQKPSLKFDPDWLPRKAKQINWRFSPHGESTPAQHKTNNFPKAWCYSDLAFFCKIEVKMEKAARLPIKFRLGDVGYVDWLEGKRSSY